MIPIYRAKKRNSDERIEGMLTLNLYDNYCIKDAKTTAYVDEIDVTTLTISFDDGMCFYRIETVQELIVSELDDDYMSH